MSKVSSKRQVTLPVDLCAIAHINAGDEVEAFSDRDGVISIVKKQSGAAMGFLKGIRANNQVSEEESLQGAIDQ